MDPCGGLFSCFPVCSIQHFGLVHCMVANNCFQILVFKDCQLSQENIAKSLSLIDGQVGWLGASLSEVDIDFGYVWQRKGKEITSTSSGHQSVL